MHVHSSSFKCFQSYQNIASWGSSNELWRALLVLSRDRAVICVILFTAINIFKIKYILKILCSSYIFQQYFRGYHIQNKYMLLNSTCYKMKEFNPLSARLFSYIIYLFSLKRFPILNCVCLRHPSGVLSHELSGLPTVNVMRVVKCPYHS